MPVEIVLDGGRLSHAVVVHHMARRILAVFAMTWLLFPGFGVVDLTVTWDRAWPRVLEAGWGVFFTVLVGVPFIAVACFMQRAFGPTAQLCVTVAVLGISAVLAAETGLFVFTIVLAVEVVIACAPTVHAMRGDQSLPRIVPHLLLTVVAVAGSGPWLVYAFHMFRLNRRGLDVFGEAGRGLETTDITMGIDHYAVQGALGIAIAVLSVLAGLVPAVRRYVGVSVGLSAGYVGLVSLSAHPNPGSLSRVWSLLCLTWATAITIVVLVAHHGQHQPIEARRTVL